MITAKQIIAFTNLEYSNLDDFEICHIRPPHDFYKNSITFLTRSAEFDELFNAAPKEVLAIIPISLKSKVKNYKQCFILSENPRLTFAKIFKPGSKLSLLSPF